MKLFLLVPSGFFEVKNSTDVCWFLVSDPEWMGMQRFIVRNDYGSRSCNPIYIKLPKVLGDIPIGNEQRHCISDDEYLANAIRGGMWERKSIMVALMQRRAEDKKS